MKGPSRSKVVSTKLQRIAKLARDAPTMVLTNLAHHIDMDLLHEAYKRTRKDGATGVDGQTAKEYGEDLEENLADLLRRQKEGRYRAPPVRRVYIPKGRGKDRRPLGIPTFEDKVLQRAVAMVLGAVYEEEFLDCSYGFRLGRSAHMMLEAVRGALFAMHGAWVLEVDIRKYFDKVDHAKLREVLHRRVRDKVLTRLVGKWLNAGVLEEGALRHPEAGTPQGGVISPLLANIYLHEVLDTWFEKEVVPRLSGTARLFRYADDVVMVFRYEEDARRVLAVLAKRLAKYGLEIHPDKTRLVDFRRPPPSAKAKDLRARKGGRSFDLLGFTHHWARSPDGKWRIKRRTAKDRLARSLKRVSDWCRRHRHRPIRVQHDHLCRVVRGHYGYYGIRDNSRAISTYVRYVQRIWRKWLDRRSDRARMKWERFEQLVERFPLPAPRLVVT